MRKKRENTTPKYLWLVIIALVLIAIWYISCRPGNNRESATESNSNKSTTKSIITRNQLSSVQINNFTDSSIISTIRKGAVDFNNEFSGKYSIILVENLGEVKNKMAVLQEMKDHFCIIHEPQKDSLELLTNTELSPSDLSHGLNSIESEAFESVSGKGSFMFSNETFLNDMKESISIGDYKIAINIKTKSGRIVRCINSISKDGQRTSGIFLFTTGIIEKRKAEFIPENQNEVVTIPVIKFLFTDIPKVTLKIHLRSRCEGRNISECEIISYGFNTHFAEVVIDSSSKKLPLSGQIRDKGCSCQFSFTCKTGLKSLNLKIGNVEIGADGIIGRTLPFNMNLYKVCGKGLEYSM